MWQIAAQLDATEQALWAENGLDTEEYLRYIAEGSSNVADNGMFSVQARTKAIRPWLHMSTRILQLKSYLWSSHYDLSRVRASLVRHISRVVRTLSDASRPRADPSSAGNSVVRTDA